jgi:hypothetical protein
MRRAGCFALYFGIVSSIFSACSGDCLKARLADVRNLLHKELKTGDSREKVDKVLTDAGIAYEYDRFQNRYQSTVTDARCKHDEAISIYVTFDPSGKVSKVEIFESYTAL